MLKLDHKYFIWGIAHEFNIVMLEVAFTYNLYVFAIEFKIAMLAANHKFHIEFIFLSLMASSCSLFSYSILGLSIMSSAS